MVQNETKNYDLTARGVSVIVTAVKSGTTAMLYDFPDDLDPITIDEAEFAELKVDANAEWYRQQKLTPVGLHISVIPGSDAENQLNGLLKDAMEGNSENKFNVQTSFITKSAGADTFKQKIFKNGYMTGCSLGYSATSQGRVRTKQYTFKFPIQTPQ